MRDEPLSGSEGLAIIQDMIRQAKNQFSENGFIYLLWGWTILTCSLGQFIMMHWELYDQHYYIWFLCWATFIVQFFYLRRRHRAQRVRTYTESIIGYVWMVFVILMFLTGVVVGIQTGAEYYLHLYPTLLALYGMPTFLSGIILRFRPLVVGGICCWLLTLAAVFIQYEYQLVLLALAVLLAWIVPGYLLRKRYKKENPGHGG